MPHHHQPNRASLPHILLLITDQFRFDAFDNATTPNLYKLATSSPLATTFSNAYSSTPTCTPARAALLTGKSPWNHGMLGYGYAVNCVEYPTTLPEVLADLLGYETMVVGKNHFGTTTTAAKAEAATRDSNNNNDNDNDKPCRNGGASGEPRFVDHGYRYMELYEGMAPDPILDDYDRFFESVLPGVDPLSTCHLDWNDWKACPYRFDEYLHPTAWTTRRALEVIDEAFLDREMKPEMKAEMKPEMKPEMEAKTTTDRPIGDRDQQTIHHHHRSAPRKPVFLKVSYHRPHSPYDPPKRFWEKHAARRNDPNYGRNIGGDPCWDNEYRNSTTNTNTKTTNTNTKTNTHDDDHPMMPHDAWHGDPGDEASRTTRAAYLANAEFVDEGIGRLLERLRSGPNPVYEDTLIVWTSDHGDANGDHYLWRKGYPWEASSHVNMIVKMPASMSASMSMSMSMSASLGTTAPSRVADPHTSDAIVELRDIAPTIYNVLGILDNVTRADPLVNGRSLLPILNGSATEVRSHLDLEHSVCYDDRIHWNAIVGRLSGGDDDGGGNGNDDGNGNGNGNGVAGPNQDAAGSHGDRPRGSNGRLYKYIFFARDGDEQLFCLSEDPKEIHDLAPLPEYESIVEFWRTAMGKQFLDEGRGEEWVTRDGDLVVGRRGITFGPNYPCRQTGMATETGSSVA